MSDFLREISERVATDQRVIRAVSDVIAEVLTSHLHNVHGGTKLYVPKTLDQLSRSKRDAKMRREFTGDNYVELAKEYGLTVRQTRRIVNAPRFRNQNKESDIRG